MRGSLNLSREDLVNSKDSKREHMRVRICGKRLKVHFITFRVTGSMKVVMLESSLVMKGFPLYSLRSMAMLRKLNYVV